MRSPHPSGGPGADERVTEVSLEPAQLRELFERDHAISGSLTLTDMEVRRSSAVLARDDSRRDQLERSIADDQWRIEEANRQVEDYDRPFKRRRHKFEIEAAHGTITSAKAATERARTELRELEARRPALERGLAEAQAAAHERPALEEQRHAIRRRLDVDMKARSMQVSADPPSYLMDRLGPWPDHGAAATLWDETAARIEQHRTAFGITDTRNLLGRRPGLGEGAYATSHRVADEACQRLDRALDRSAAIEPPHPSLGLSL
jgi:hypothetical protein